MLLKPLSTSALSFASTTACLIACFCRNRNYLHTLLPHLIFAVLQFERIESTTLPSPSANVRVDMLPINHNSRRTRRPTIKFTENNSSTCRLPDLMECIQVLWTLDGSVIWWDAEVISMSEPTSQRNQRRATLRYSPRFGYDSVDYRVDFQAVESETKRLKHINPGTADFTPWKFPNETVSENFYVDEQHHSPTTHGNSSSASSQVSEESCEPNNVRRTSRVKRSKVPPPASCPRRKQGKRTTAKVTSQQSLSDSSSADEAQLEDTANDSGNPLQSSECTVPVP